MNRHTVGSVDIFEAQDEDRQSMPRHVQDEELGRTVRCTGVRAMRTQITPRPRRKDLLLRYKMCGTNRVVTITRHVQMHTTQSKIRRPAERGILSASSCAHDGSPAHLVGGALWERRWTRLPATHVEVYVVFRPRATCPCQRQIEGRCLAIGQLRIWTRCPFA